MNHRMVFLVRLFGLLFFILLSGCVKTADVPEGLENHGILPLSDENPFLGTNVFLSAEMERSPYLYNFLKRRGSPAAIEIARKLRTSNPVVHLYYPQEGEFYSAEASVHPDYRQWIVRGPYRLHWKDLRATRNILNGLKREPVFFVYGKEMRFGEQSALPIRVLQPSVPRVTKKVVKAAVQKAPVSVKKNEPVKQVAKAKASSDYVNDYDPAEFRPLNTDQQAILMARGYAERAIDGDIIHTSKSETLGWEALAEWYTGNVENADAILHHNPDLAILDLVPGTRIKIPKKMIREYRVMPADYAVKARPEQKKPENKVAETEAGKSSAEQTADSLTDKIG